MRAKTILITGATAGIGRFAALHLLQRGHRVLASGRNTAALAALKTEAGALPLETLPLDVTDAASIAAAAAEVQSERSVDGSKTGSAQDGEDTLAFSVLQNIRPMIETVPLEQAADAYARMMQGKPRFRMVLVTGAPVHRS